VFSRGFSWQKKHSKNLIDFEKTGFAAQKISRWFCHGWSGQVWDDRNMAIFVISEVEIVDESLVSTYQSLAEASIAQYGGRYLARGGTIEVVEGNRPAGQRVIVAEFPSMERAHEWYASPEYAQALQVRERALDRRLTFVEGL